jgi:hypothetical protein
MQLAVQNNHFLSTYVITKFVKMENWAYSFVQLPALLP